MEFHIARSAREHYRFSESLFSYTGNVILASMNSCRELAHRMNQVREANKYPERALHAGQLYAMGLIDEASHVVVARYRQQFDPQVMARALDWFSAQVGSDSVDKMLLTFVDLFPGVSVIRGEQTPAQWLAGSTGDLTHREAALEELMLLWTANRNEAFKPFEELFAETALAEKTVYRQVTARMTEYFATRPLIPAAGGRAINLLDLLREPALRAPKSLSDQLAVIRELWAPLLGDQLERLLLMAGEILREEQLAIWTIFNPQVAEKRAEAQRGRTNWEPFTSRSEVPIFGDPAFEYEKFSPDTDWMPSTVLIAKSTYVWLAQLSRKYGRHIGRLDEIPDEELALLAARGLNSLWLIGVWERSRASKTIKQLCGNKDAVASAYSLFDYTIAEDLGGDAAYVNLRDRAYRYGVRLASDMVPNHMGIDSPWVIEHPDWFISRSEPPYPAYSFNGPDLSHDPRVEIKIEDHYFDQTDAAVVFQRRDRSSGEIRYVYHGNDGTSFPWNDTAQLDYLNPAAREQVMQTILHVARLFPVIRFDAAMTLAKRHFHRLWFPGPGSSGAIPSRAEDGMSDAEFDRLMPHEFWREVVDRVAAEVPGTLLLAEAFWLMEGYFVRTLGMHRVYNSAFMNMMRDEENAKYRSVIKNTLEFDPDVMKRYVNFMSNPDERTAIDQFGTGDKCFGVAVMMSTLPGLPMFGHGQIEGFTEKYGMEYRWPRYQESPNPHLVERHEREVAPLLKRRWLFAESSNFLLYDFFTLSGAVDENVFAYSNRNHGQSALVVYNNRFSNTRGTIDFSAAYADKGAGKLRQRRLRDGLALGDGSGAVFAWRDSLTGLHYLCRAGEINERGLTLDLHAYQCRVLLDWRELQATAHQPWDRLSDWLNGRGVPSLEDAFVDLELQPVHEALRALLDQSLVRQFADLAEQPRSVAAAMTARSERERTEFAARASVQCDVFVQAAQKSWRARQPREGKSDPVRPAGASTSADEFRKCLRSAMRLPVIESLFPSLWPASARRVLPSASPRLTATAMWGPVLAWCALDLLAESIDPTASERVALDLFDRLRLREPFAQSFASLGFEGEEAWRVAARIKVLLLVGAGVGAAESASSDSPKSEVVGPVAPIEHSKSASPSTKASSLATGHDSTHAQSTPIPAAQQGPAASTPGLPPAAAGNLALAPALWLDPDVRWLTGVHKAKGHFYLIREQYEELLWWLLVPRLLRLAAGPTPAGAEIDRMAATIEEALAAAESAGYRVDILLGPTLAAQAATVTEPEAESTEPEPESEVAADGAGTDPAR